MGVASALAAKGFTNATQQQVTSWLSTGNPVLDHRLSGRYVNGGFALGRIHEIAGPSSAGKTAIATNVMAAAQQQGGVAIFMDHEHSFDVNLAKTRMGLTDDPDHWVYDQPMTYEESWDRVKDILYTIRGIEITKTGKINLKEPLVPYETPVVVVFDSLASMTPQQKFLKESEKQGMNDALSLAKLTSQTFDVMASIAELTKTGFLFLNQVRMKPGVMYGDPTTTPGGNAPEFYCSTRVRLGKQIIKDDKTGQKLGTRVGCEVVKNKTYRPFGKCQWDFLFLPDGSGVFDVTGAVIDELIEIGAIEAGGGWITWEGKKRRRSELVQMVNEEGTFPMLMDLFPK